MISLVLIVRNEEKNIKDYIEKLDWGPLKVINEVIIVDTGSTDSTITKLRELEGIFIPSYLKVFYEGNKFDKIVTEQEIKNFEKRFGFTPSIKVGDLIFDFSEARNYATSKALNNEWVLIGGVDWNVNGDFDKLKEDMNGQDAISFSFELNKSEIFSRTLLYKKDKMKWKDVIHEWLSPIKEEEKINKKFTESIKAVQHIQNGRGISGKYLKHLEFANSNQNTGRLSYYLGREYFLVKQWEKAIKLLKYSSELGLWKPEESQCYNYVARCYKNLQKKKEELKYLYKSLMVDPSRREPFYALARYYYDENDYQNCIAFCKAGLEIRIKKDYYFCDAELYTWKIYNLLQMAYSRIEGGFEEAKKYWLKCLEYLPENEGLRSNFDYYFPKGKRKEGK